MSDGAPEYCPDCGAALADAGAYSECPNHGKIAVTMTVIGP